MDGPKEFPYSEGSQEREPQFLPLLSRKELFATRLRKDHILCVNTTHPKFETMARTILWRAGFQNILTLFDELLIQEAYTQPSSTIGNNEYYILFSLRGMSLQRKTFLGRCVIDVLSISDASGCPAIKQTELMEMM